MLRNVLIFSVTLLCTGLCGELFAQPDVTAVPRYGTYNLVTGFEPDPTTYAVTAGGSFDASAIRIENLPCGAGFVAEQPDVRIHYSAGSGPLTFYVDTAGTDPTLAINDPAGNWTCNDDWASLMPKLTFDAPLSGQYDIFVGTFAEGENPSVTLFVSELPAAGPSN